MLVILYLQHEYCSLFDIYNKKASKCDNPRCIFLSFQMDEFIIEAVNLGQIRRVRIGHDGKGGGCGWFLDKVIVREEGQAEAQAIEFPCNRCLHLNMNTETN